MLGCAPSAVRTAWWDATALKARLTARLATAGWWSSRPPISHTSRSGVDAALAGLLPPAAVQRLEGVVGLRRAGGVRVPSARSGRSPGHPSRHGQLDAVDTRTVRLCADVAERCPLWTGERPRWTPASTAVFTRSPTSAGECSRTGVIAPVREHPIGQIGVDDGRRRTYGWTDGHLPGHHLHCSRTVCPDTSQTCPVYRLVWTLTVPECAEHATAGVGHCERTAGHPGQLCTDNVSGQTADTAG